jgi:predicted dehydrogenase
MRDPFLLIGCGSIGKRHLRNLQQLGVKNWIAYDPREDRREEVRQRFATGVAASLDEAFARGAKVALVCSPTKYHLEHALAAARAGCHLFIEKPVAESSAGLDQLLEEITARNLLTLVGCNFRFHPGLRQVKELLTQNCIGRVISARAQFGQYLPDWHPWEDYRKGYSARRDLGGGVVLDRIHELDYIRWLMGEVRQVTALVGTLSRLEIDTEDCAEVLLRFTSGAFGSVHLDYVRRTYDCSLEITGDEGTILWNFQECEVRWFTARENCWQSRGWNRYDPNSMYVEQMNHFLRMLAGQEKSVQSAQEGARVLALALAAKQSALEQKWINL